MAKIKSVFVCTSCGAQQGRWMGKCPGCGEWNTLEERAPEPKSKSKTATSALFAEAPTPIHMIPQGAEERFRTGIGEFDRVLGGGVVPGSLLILGGDPGIGKSTLLLQVSHNVARESKRALYVSGEESLRQLRLRATRLGALSEGIWVSCETRVSHVIAQIESTQPDFVVIDSIQTMASDDSPSSPGSVSQVRECAQALMHTAKATGCAVFLVGHVTKEGSLAGPRVLEHMVDAVLQFHGDRRQGYRILRAVKNRFGSVNEIGIFEMAREGMREVANPSEFLISQRKAESVGSVITCAMEGLRPVLVDVQALVAPSFAGNPRRQAQGFDASRLSMLLAVLEKRVGLMLYNQDAYVNIAGGLELDEPAADLPLVCAIASSFKGQAAPEGFAVVGEVGLTGEVRAISDIDRRIAECARLGVKNLILPKANKPANAGAKELPGGIRLHAADTVREALTMLYV